MSEARPVVLINGVERYRANPVVRFLLDEASAGRPCDLNRIHVHEPLFLRADLEELYQLIGMSLQGLAEVQASLDDEGRP